MFDIYKRVSQLANTRRLSVRELSRLAGLHQTTLYSAKYKGSELKVSTVESLCDAMGISLAEFFDEDGQYRRRAQLEYKQDDEE